MNVNELCYPSEIDQGFNAHYIDFSIIIYHNGTPWMQVENEKSLHEIIALNSKKGGQVYG